MWYVWMELVATYLVTLAFAHNNIFIDLHNMWMVASKNRLKFGFGVVTEELSDRVSTAAWNAISSAGSIFSN